MPACSLTPCLQPESASIHTCSLCAVPFHHMCASVNKGAEGFWDCCPDCTTGAPAGAAAPARREPAPPTTSAAPGAVAVAAQSGDVVMEVEDGKVCVVARLEVVKKGDYACHDMVLCPVPGCPFGKGNGLLRDSVPDHFATKSRVATHGEWSVQKPTKPPAKRLRSQPPPSAETLQGRLSNFFLKPREAPAASEAPLEEVRVVAPEPSPADAAPAPPPADGEAPAPGPPPLQWGRLALHADLPAAGDAVLQPQQGAAQTRQRGREARVPIIAARNYAMFDFCSIRIRKDGPPKGSNGRTTAAEGGRRRPPKAAADGRRRRP